MQAFGVAPDAVAGHSFGELTALCAAGWIDEDDFLDLAAARGRAMAVRPQPGAMLAVRAPLAEIERAARPVEASTVVLANRNGPEQGVLSGRARCDRGGRPSSAAAAGWPSTPLPVGGAFHSPLMQDAQAAFFVKALEAVRIAPTPVPVFSNSTGRALPGRRPTRPGSCSASTCCSRSISCGEIEAMYAGGMCAPSWKSARKPVLTGLVGIHSQGPAVPGHRRRRVVRKTLRRSATWPRPSATWPRSATRCGLRTGNPPRPTPRATAHAGSRSPAPTSAAPSRRPEGVPPRRQRLPPAR
ncbi:MAG: acyltransferase domain-containing protein [Desulfobacterales bacterium]|nr:acyltransferase domain-containing protein [Desulfobacterales bacterium]